MAAAALLKRNPNPTPDELLAAMEGNICRCTGYKHIVEGIRQAMEEWSGQEGASS